MKNKGAEWSTIPWTSGSNTAKAMASGKSSTKSAEDLHEYSNCVVDFNEWVRWMVSQYKAVSSHEHESNPSKNALARKGPFFLLPCKV